MPLPPLQNQSNSPTSDNTSTAAAVRPKRRKRITQRAQDLLATGEGVPGIAAPDPSLQQYLAAQTPSSSSLSSPSSRPSSSATNRMPVSNACRPTGRHPHPTTSTSRPKQTSTTAGPPPPPALPAFTPDTLTIYPWPRPHPKDFTHLPPHLQTWKAQTDARDRADDMDDGADDWADFSFDRADYPSPQRGGRGAFALEYAIASTFVKRAKRAFWARKSWGDFDFEERTAGNGNAGAAAASMEGGTDDALRLAVYDALRRRLCEEIWGLEYKDPPGLIRLAVAPAQQQQRQRQQQQQPQPPRDSKLPTPAPPLLSAADARREHYREPPTPEQASRGIAYWSVDGNGHRQPVLQGQSGVADGMANFMRDIREQARQEAMVAAAGGAQAAAMRENRTRGRRIGNIGVRGLVVMSAAEEVGMRELDFSESEVEDEG